MKERKKSNAFRFMVGVLALSLMAPCVTVYAQLPETEQKTVAISEANEGSSLVANNDSFQNSLTQNDAYLSSNTEKFINDIAAGLDNNTFYSALIKRSFIDQLGAENLENFQKKDAAHATFLSSIMADTELMNQFLQGRVDYSQERLLKSLELWKSLWENDKDCHQGFYAKLAIATALAHSNPIKTYDSNASVINPIVRYEHYKKLKDDGKLFPSFDKLDVTHLTMVVNVQISERDIDWMQDYLRTEKPEFVNQSSAFKAAFLVPYGKRDGKNYAGEWRLKDLLEIGGVCTRLSAFGSFACRSFGEPAMRIRQPGHMAFLYMKTEDTWQIGNNIGGFGSAYNDRRTNIPWGNHPVYSLVFEEATQDKANLEKSMQLLWLSKAVQSTTDQEKILDEATHINSLNFFAWDYRVDYLLNQKTINTDWNQIKSDIIEIFTHHPQAMIDLINKLPKDQIVKSRSDLQKLNAEIYAAFDKVTDDRQTSMISKKLNKELQVGDLAFVQFSFNGENAGRLMGIKQGEKYSFNGGKTYKTAASDDMQLTAEEIASINSTDNLLVKATDKYTPCRIHIYESNLKSKDIVANNDTNTITGMNSSMEYSTDKITWTNYTKENFPDLTGNIVLYIRKSAKGTYLPSNILTRKFTSAVFSFDGENANRLMGMLKNDQYSLDGGKTYKTAAEDNLLLTNEEIASITSTNNIMFKQQGSEDSVTILIDKAELKDKTFDKNDMLNSITGIDKTMEFSVDDQTSWTKFTGDNLPNLSGNITIHIRKSATGNQLPSNIITRKFTAASFSFSGENAGRLMGITPATEYSLDGGKTYTTPTENDVLLRAEELASINPTNGILVRMKGTENTVLIKIAKHGLLYSTIKTNDKKNTLTGIRTSMEFSIDDQKTWTKYTGDNLPDLTGNVTILVRKAASGTTLPSRIVTRKFTAASFSFSGENAGRLMGITPATEYSLDGGNTYTTPSENDVLLSKDERTSINADDDIKLRMKGTDAVTVIDIKKSSTLLSRNLQFNDKENSIRLNKDYEYSVDGKETWTKFTGDNDPDLTGNGTIYVRKYAKGTTLTGNIVTLKFTAASFSFSGENAGRLMGITPATEYSIDGGNTYTTPSENDVLLSKDERTSINADDGILLRMKDTDNTSCIGIRGNGLHAYYIKMDNTANTLTGVRDTMEFSIDNKETWTKYTGDNLPDLSGDVTIHVRKFAKGTTVASNIVTRTFTE